MIGTFFCVFVPLFADGSDDLVHLTTNSFKKKVLKSDDTWFVMFHTKTCPACHEMLPDFEQLATRLKPIGINVGDILIDKYPEFGRVYQCYSVPKLLLFRPNREPKEYASYRTAKMMAEFVLENQVGRKQIKYIEEESELEPYLANITTKPKMLLVSKKKTIPPMFKQICFKHRKDVTCGFITENDGFSNKVMERLAAIDSEVVEGVGSPSLFFIWKNKRSDEEPARIQVKSEGLTYDSIQQDIIELKSSIKKSNQVDKSASEEVKSEENNVTKEL
ncbi:hypothetical protein BLNAU_10836 [Blattamonas nauphoetae]|uniref:Thioredoxin domain-containing protein n=1 Tax=Blattamonas nauphoetae TaxID=2049346 RepID=A0ABQ9XRJ9_9EUKA|nr:hypothetical protein BLNAU_10836 [Blattamonas nauphoetae]